MRALEITECSVNGVPVISLSGRLTANTAGEFEQRLIARIDAGARRLVVDLGGMDYIGSAGLRVLIIMAKRMADDGGRFAVCCLQEFVREVFEIAGVPSLFPICATRDEALATVT